MSIYDQEIDYNFALRDALERQTDPTNKKRIAKEIAYSSLRAREIDLILNTNRIEGYDILRTGNEVERMQPVRYLPVTHPRRLGDFRRNSQNGNPKLTNEDATEPRD